MIELNIPGRGVIQIEHLVCDVNGTLAIDGQLSDGVIRKLTILRDRVTLHLLTADTHGKQKIIDQQLNLQAVRIKAGQEAKQKADYVNQLGAQKVIAIGQGANDAGMLAAAVVGIGVFSAEGIAVESLLAADLIAPDILAALDLLEKPVRIVATLRK